MNLYREALEIFGQELQQGMVEEECAELIIAINKYRRYHDAASLEHLIEEAVDVEHCIRQLREMFIGHEQLWEKIRKEKLDRLYYKLHPEVDNAQ